MEKRLLFTFLILTVQFTTNFAQSSYYIGKVKKKKQVTFDACYENRPQDPCTVKNVTFYYYLYPSKNKEDRIFLGKAFERNEEFGSHLGKYILIENTDGKNIHVIHCNNGFEGKDRGKYSVKDAEKICSGFKLFSNDTDDKNANDHSLSWITSKNDLDQSGMTESEIDVKIGEIIFKAVSSGLPNRDIQVPINKGKLKYVGYLHPNETGLFDANKVSEVNSKELNSKLHVYNYDNFYLSTEGDDEKDQLNIYYSIRAIEIIKNRYPEGYKNLFLDTQQFQDARPQYQMWQNSNKAFWIAFNTSPEYIASNNTNFLADGSFPAPNNDINAYKNIAIVNIHSENIMGKFATKGSGAIYKKMPDENYKLYLAEGLVESIVHEMLHNYIDYAYPFNDRFNKIRAARSQAGFNFAEENAVLNTSLNYFKSKGGFSHELINYYYEHVFNPNTKRLRDENHLEDYGVIISGEPVQNEKEEVVFLLPIFQ